MINRKFVDYLSGKSGIKNKVLIEKDFILQAFLASLAKDAYFSKNFVFKGGTCLIKCYLGYFRFSEDLDFTYINQDLFKDKSEKGIRRLLSSEIGRLLDTVSMISKEQGMDFKAEKDNTKYIEFGGSNKFVTLKTWYLSSVIEREQFIKIQINFVELFRYRLKKREIKSITEDIDEKEARFLFPEYSGVLLSNPRMITYDIKEILLEKARAVLTRREIKARDFIDIFLITDALGKNVGSFKRDIILKVRFMLKYEKYRRNLEEKLKTKTWVKAGEEEYLLLKPLKGFEPFVKKVCPLLDEMVSESLGAGANP